MEIWIILLLVNNLVISSLNIIIQDKLLLILRKLMHSKFRKFNLTSRNNWKIWNLCFKGKRKSWFWSMRGLLVRRSSIYGCLRNYIVNHNTITLIDLSRLHISQPKPNIWYPVQSQPLLQLQNTTAIQNNCQQKY